MIKLILSPIITWLIAESIKISIRSKKTKKINELWRSGGMPSAHSAVVAALTLAIFFHQGFTPLFIVTLILSFLVIRDTMLRPKELRHKPTEVLAGTLLGLIISYIIYII